MTFAGLLAAAFAAGLLGSGHCFGMCGPIVVLLENTPRGEAGWLRRLTYNIGRLLFYMLLGAIAGAAGLVLTKAAGVATGLQILRMLAAVLVIALGLNLLFEMRLLAFLEKGGAVIWRRLSPLARHVLPVSSLPRALAAGFIWGALPCGLVYSAVAMAATSGTAASGALLMLAFWSGTLPALLLAGTAAKRVNELINTPLLRRLSGLILVAVGIIALALPFWHGAGGQDGHHHDARELSQ